LRHVDFGVMGPMRVEEVGQVTTITLPSK